MSYQEGGNVPPFVLSVSPTAVSNSGPQSFTIEGSRFSPSMKLDVPSAFGTLVSQTITYPTSTTSRCVAVIDVVQPTTTLQTYQIKLLNGGECSPNSIATVTTLDFTPADLLTDPSHTWFRAEDIATQHASMNGGAGIADGDKFASWAPAYGNLGSLVQTSSTYQPKYRASVAELNGHPAIDYRKVSSSYSTSTMAAHGLKQQTANYMISPSGGPNTFAFVYAPYTTRSSVGIHARFGFDNQNRGFNWLEHHTAYTYPYWSGVYPGHSAHPYYPNNNHNSFASNFPTAPRKVIFSHPAGTGSATDGTYTEPVTQSGPVVVPGVSSSAGTLFGSKALPYGQEFYLAEMIHLSGYEITSTQRTLLETYWTQKYG